MRWPWGEAGQHVSGTDFAKFSGDESRKSPAAVLFNTFFAVACLGQGCFRPGRRNR